MKVTVDVKNAQATEKTRATVATRGRPPAFFEALTRPSVGVYSPYSPRYYPEQPLTDKDGINSNVLARKGCRVTLQGDATISPFSGCYTKIRRLEGDEEVKIARRAGNGNDRRCSKRLTSLSSSV